MTVKTKFFCLFLLTVSPIFKSDSGQSNLSPISTFKLPQYAHLDPDFLQYNIGVKRVINPNNRDLKGISGGAGMDIANYLLSTNARKSYFVSTYHGLSQADLERELPQLTLESNRQFFLAFNRYTYEKRMHGFIDEGFLLTKQTVLFGLATELIQLGVDLKKVKISSHQGHPRIQFQWAYPGRREQTYTIIFIEADITQPSQYPPALQDFLSQGFHVYYQRAGEYIPKSYQNFIPYLNNYMHPGGYFVTDDYGGVTSVGFGLKALFNFPLPLKEIPIPEIEEHFARVGQHAESNYGWHVRVRQKPVRSPLDLVKISL